MERRRHTQLVRTFQGRLGWSGGDFPFTTGDFLFTRTKATWVAWTRRLKNTVMFQSPLKRFTIAATFESPSVHQLC